MTEQLERKSFYYLNRSNLHTTIVIAESREHVMEGFWYVISQGESCKLNDISLFDSIQKTIDVATEILIDRRKLINTMEQNLSNISTLPTLSE